MVPKGWKPGAAPPFQRSTVNLSHCAPFVCLSRAIDETGSRLVLVAKLLLPYQPLLHVPGRFSCMDVSRTSVQCHFFPSRLLSTKPTLSPMKRRVVHSHAIIPPVLRGVQRRRPFPMPFSPSSL